MNRKGVSRQYFSSGKAGITVRAFCEVCKDQEGAEVEMASSARMYVSLLRKSQSREYQCPECRTRINIVILRNDIKAKVSQG